jgi:hypothetical protein
MSTSSKMFCDPGGRKIVAVDVPVRWRENEMIVDFSNRVIDETQDASHNLWRQTNPDAEIQKGLDLYSSEQNTAAHWKQRRKGGTQHCSS